MTSKTHRQKHDTARTQCHMQFACWATATDVGTASVVETKRAILRNSGMLKPGAQPTDIALPAPPKARAFENIAKARRACSSDHCDRIEH